jgi:hypothetical protein
MFLIRMTHHCIGIDEEGVPKFEDLDVPKYWTGRRIENWPVYSRHRENAKVLKRRSHANLARSNFKGSMQSQCLKPPEDCCPFKPGFCWEVVPA